MKNNKRGFEGGSKQLKNDYKIDVEMAAAAVECGICLDPVSDDGKRSWAKLECNHKFHLDCIGSAFNAKGVMECPNCRKVEKGQWLFANGSTTTQSRRANPIRVDSFPDLDMGIQVLGQSFYDELDAVLDMGLPDVPDLSGLFSVGYSSSLPTFTHLPSGPYSGVSFDEILDSFSFASSGPFNPASYGYINEEPESIPMHRSSRRHVHHRGGGEQQRATPVSVHHSARPGRSVTTPPATRLTPHPNSLQRTRDRVQALQAYPQQSSNPVSTQASFSASGSRSNNSQNNNTPTPYSSNHPATNHLQSNSSLGRENYLRREQVHDGYEYNYEPHVVRRPRSMRRRRSEFEGSRHHQNQGRF